jgi:hypothetical protein
MTEKTNKKKRDVHMQLTEYALEMLDKASEETGINRTSMIEIIIRKYCERQELI